MNEQSQTDGFRERVDKNLQEMAEDMRDIKTALIGNGMGTTGIVPRLDKVEKKQQWIERIYLLGTGIVLAIGALYTVIRDYWLGHK